jgi:S1-C subfamily serine protease
MPPRLACFLTLLLVAPASANEDDGKALQRSLEARVARAAKGARHTVARIYVSRSDAYEKAVWGETVGNASAGELGRFDADAARKRVPADAGRRARILQAIDEHDLSDPRIVPESFGSGIVIDPKGLVLTCSHVVRNARRVYVRLPGKPGSWADIHASDPRSDLAVLRLLDPPAGLVATPLGRGGLVREGNIVVCIANGYEPRFRPEPTVKYGLVNARRRQAPGKGEEVENTRKTLAEFGTLLQVDAQAAPGCSGGVLIDLDGKAVGLTTAIAAIAGAESAGFAMPFDTNTRRIIEVLERGEEVEYGFLGVTLDREVEGNVNGVRLASVVPGSPAFRAGLRAHDLIRVIDRKPVRNNADLFLFVGMALAGNTVRVDVQRVGGPKTCNVTLAKYSVFGNAIAAKRPAARFGLRVDYNSILAQRNAFVLRWPADGVAIREVVPGSAADKARLQPEKLITHVDGRPVLTPAAFYKAIARAGKTVEITYAKSDGQPERLTLEEK